MPRTEEQFKEIREEKKQAIMEVALDLFSNEGYHSTSISKIAKEAKISKGLIYNYFESKEALLKEIVTVGFKEIMENFDPNKDGVLTREEFIYFIKTTLRIVKENVSHWKLFYGLMLQPEVLASVGSEFMESAGRINILAQAMFERNGFSNPEGEMLLFSSLIEGAMIQYVFSPEMFPIEKFEKAVIQEYTRKLKMKSEK